MVKFREGRTRVLSFDIEFNDIYWEIETTNDDLQEYDFTVERSETETGPFIDISGPLIDRFYLRDNSTFQKSHNRRYFYRVRAKNRLTGNEVCSQVVSRMGDLPLDAQEIVRLEHLLWREFSGAQFWLFPRRTFGQRCPQCYDRHLEKVVDSKCRACWSTGFSGGYHYPMDFWAQVDTGQNTEQRTIDDHRQTNYFGLRTCNTPNIKPQDLIIDHLNRRFRVISVDSTTRLGKPVHQEVKMVQVERGTIEYGVPLKVDAATEPLVPQRLYTNPHTISEIEEEADPTNLADILGPYGYNVRISDK